MKKKILFLLIVLFAFCVLTACGGGESGGNKEKVVKAILVNDDSEVCVDEFDYDVSKFTIVFEDDSTLDVTPSEVILSNEDYEKLFEVGVHNVTLTYKGQEISSKIAICNSEEDMTKPTSANYVYSRTHYKDGKHFTTFYVDGNGENPYYAFEFKLKYNKEKVSNLTITKGSEFGSELEINDNGERVSINYVNSKEGKTGIEILTIEYTSEEMYKNFILDVQCDYGFYRVTNDNVYVLNTSFNLNW